MQVSIVIPLYNKAPFIKRALDSVLLQSIRNYEIIIVDDGSTDNGPDFVAQYKDGRIRIIRQTNSGVSAARNRGIEEAKGKWIAFLDADDEWKPRFLESIAILAENYPGAGIYTTAYEKKRPDGNQVIARYKYIPPPPWEGILPSYFKSAAYGDPPVCASAVCIPKIVFDKVGMFKNGRRMGEDLDLWGRIALLYPVAFSWILGAIYHEDALDRACVASFTEADEHPFIETYHTLNEKERLAVNEKELELYVGRLRLENARQHVLCANYVRARQLLSNDDYTPSVIRKILWGSHLNRLTHLAWQAKYKAR